MTILVMFFTYVALKQARRNDQLIEHGHRERIAGAMRKSAQRGCGSRLPPFCLPRFKRLCPPVYPPRPTTAPKRHAARSKPRFMR